MGFCPFNGHVGNQPFDVKDESQHRIFVHGGKRILTAADGEQGHITINAGFPSPGGPQTFQGLGCVESDNNIFCSPPI